MRVLIDANKGDADKKMKKLRDNCTSILDNLIEIVEHMFHQILIFSQDNDVEDDGLLEITNSASETKPYKYDT